MALIQKTTSVLWFDGQAEEAANFYISVFKSGKINRISYYGNEGRTSMDSKQVQYSSWNLNSTGRSSWDSTEVLISNSPKRSPL